MSLRVLIADDHAIVRQGIRHVLEADDALEVEVVGEASDGKETVDRVAELQPDIAVVDAVMPNLSGIEAARQVAARVPSTKVLIISMHTEENYIRQALMSGARGYVLKDAADVELGQALRAISDGGSFLSPRVAAVVLEDYVSVAPAAQGGRYEKLSPREREVMQLLAEGHSSRMIAARLGLSVPTVDTHRANIFKKLGVHSLAELVLFAVRHGITS